MTGPESEACFAKTATHEFQYEGWRVEIAVDRMTAEGVVSGHADLYDSSAFRCRLMLSGRHRDDVSAIRALADKARVLIDERSEKDTA